VVVETALGGSAAEAWLHQLRWSRTVRISRPGGYLGYLVTHATVWGLVAFAAGQWWAAAIALGVRLAAGALSTALLRDRQGAQLIWLIPVRDLLGFAVWLCGLFGTTVRWRGRVLSISRDGRINRVMDEREAAAEHSSFA
jgi:ceramide glucosyltransferase